MAATSASRAATGASSGGSGGSRGNSTIASRAGAARGRGGYHGRVVDPDREPGRMASNALPRWDPRSEAVLRNQIAAFDEMRRGCPLARSRYGYTSLFRHADVLRVLHDHETFSSAVSRHPSVPNGMDPPEHTAFRRLIEPYFGPAEMAAFEPACRAIAARLVAGLPRDREVELVAQFAQPFALEIPCAWLGWPEALHEPLRLWTRKNHAATLARDEAAMEAVAREFDGHIRALLAERRDAGEAAPGDITTRLLRDESLGR